MSLDDHRAPFLDALLRRDSARARRVVEDALEAGTPVPEIYLGVLEPAMREVGHRWAMGTLNVAEEHYATAVAQSILDGLSRQLRRAPCDGRLAIVTGSPEEQHVLGAGAPTRDLVALVESEQPDLVALSTATAGVLDGVAEVLSALSALRPRPYIAAGGQFWTAQTSETALELGAALVLHDPRELGAVLRERIPPLGIEAN